VKRYEEYYPLDAQPLARGAKAERGYQGYIEYRYEIYRSAAQDTRVEAEAESANIPTGRTGREVMRYQFSATGNWDGDEGTLANR